MHDLNVILKMLGYNEAHAGTEALRRVIRFYDPEAGLLAAYIEAAKADKSTWVQVERVIRYATAQAVLQAGPEVWADVFGPMKKPAPPNKRVIVTLWRLCYESGVFARERG